jgi:CheY-like chemotaxis protein/anti-sigma regulatory factor (Ser/Thr protein kinase)
MSDCGHRLLETISNIVEVAKISSGQIEEYVSLVDLKETMQTLYNHFNSLVRHKGIEFIKNVTIQDELAWVRTDKYKLDVILSNLLSNALKFTKTGFIEMGAYLYEDQIVFYIKDTGTGIPEEKMHVIFDRFMQIDSSSTRQFEGLGLGLSIVKAYIEALSGKIWIESEVGSGSTFFFTIPLEMETKKDPDGCLKASEIITILIAEDDQVSFELYKSVLEHANINILQAKDGMETVNMAMEHPEISLILMDIRMPNLDGKEASRRIRAFNAEVPIIAQTAYAFENDKIDCLEAGCNDFISKPIHPVDLMRIIKKYLPVDTGESIG